jgi:hypothetical protein
MQSAAKAPLFPLGEVFATPGALAAIEKAGQSPAEFLSRHMTGDWGDLPIEDRMENHHGLQLGFRLLSSYHTAANERLWVITENDRSATTLLPPREY